MVDTRSRGRRLGVWVGLAMMLVGVLMLGWAGWQFWGTNWIAHREHDKITESLQTKWTDGGTRLQPEFVPAGEASALVRVPRFGQDYVVPVLEGVDPDALSRGFGHFSESADPGAVGNYALAAHRVTHGEPLRRMPDLRPGDELIVETVDASYVYRLDTDPEELVIPFTSVWVLDALPKNPQEGGPQPSQKPGQRMITLTTCSEIFHTDDRMITFGHLVRAVEKER